MKTPTPVDQYWQPLLILFAIVCSVGFTFPANNSLNNLPQEGDSLASSLLGGADQIGKAEDLVKDWPKPDFTLFVTGRQHGYIEPCGCITLERQKGGLMRRHRVMKILQGRGWDLVPIDAGNQIRRIGQQPLIKMGRTYDSLCRIMNYDVIGLGPDDLKIAPIDLVQKMDSAKQGDKTPFTCANITPFDDPDFTNPFQIIVKNGKRIGVTTILGKEHVGAMGQNPMLNVKDPVVALQQIAPKIEDARCDMNVLVAFTNLPNCRDLAKQFPVFDVLVTAGGAGDPTLQPEIIQANGQTTAMIQVGVKGMYVGLIGWYFNDGQPTIRYKRVQLDHRYNDTEEIKTVFKAYQDELKGLWIGGNLKDIEPRDHPSGHSFVGSDKCADCHDEEYDIWADGVDGNGGPHYDATANLEKNPNDNRVWVQRHFDPECISCHATGWNPQNFYPYKTGLMNADNPKDSHLHANGCENCHGPGSAHVEMELAAAKGKVDKDLRNKLTSDMVLTLADARASSCKECHDLDNSPDFLKENGFDEYWPKIKHGRTAVKKVHDLFSKVVAGKRPLKDVNVVQDWMTDLKKQDPGQAYVVESTMNSLRQRAGDPMSILKTALAKIEIE